jgi:predicted AAA+ superfamily ATPase
MARSSSTRAGIYPRFARDRLSEALRDTPVVLLHGPRQSGKTTLARSIGDRAGYAYFTFDDDNIASAARADSVGFVADLPRRVVLDEVQRVPELFTSLKAAVDRDRVPGRFLLTGSANVLLLPKLADSLAGRMEVQRLYPLAQCEIARRRPSFLDAMLSGSFRIRRYGRLGPGLADRVVSGGYPAALARSPARRTAWYRAYIETLTQRDVRDLARIGALDAIPRLLEMAAGQTARLVNISDLAAPFQLSRPTIRDYLTLLERLFLVEFQPPWHSNRLSRLIKTPKLHLGDTGLACALLRLDAAALLADRAMLGQLLETFVFHEMRRQASWRQEPAALFHFRDKDGYEVDLVIETSAAAIAGIEVKAAGTVTERDLRGLRRLKEATGQRFRCGVVLYDGDTALPFAEDMFAVPIRALWDGA